MSITKHAVTIVLTVSALALQGDPGMVSNSVDNHQHATLGGGCFWCVEAVFDEVAGVVKAEAGYAGGQTKSPDYREVCDGTTGHAEVVQVTFDPEVISYEEILLIFFGVHDPTTRNRQGADVGTQYRSIVLAHDDAQLAAVRSVIDALSRDEVFENPIVTEVETLADYWPAEEYHQDYFSRNPAQGYCQAVIAPKLAKFRKNYSEKLRR